MAVETPARRASPRNQQGHGLSVLIAVEQNQAAQVGPGWPHGVRGNPFDRDRPRVHLVHGGQDQMLARHPLEHIQVVEHEQLIESCVVP